jgi:hypothetical protein
MLTRWDKFILLPMALLIASIIFGLEFQRHDRAFEIMVGTYALWNSYHFGMQNFGLAALAGQRLVGFIVACVTILGMSVLPLVHPPVGLGLVAFFGFSFSHWIGDIWLSGKVSRWAWWFILAAVLAAPLGFFVKAVGCDAAACYPMMSNVPLILSVRLMGTGFIHFLYEMWIWKFSDPQVKATIGRDLFKRPQLRLVA